MVPFGGGKHVAAFITAANTSKSTLEEAGRGKSLVQEFIWRK